MRPDTLPLTVSNTGFLLDRLGQDCAPLQYIRELTQNSIEAIARAGVKKGRILWDVDWTTHDLDSGKMKLSITDNGDGMSGEDMLRYINQLSSSGSAQSIGGNYGVGAKIAAATKNPAGLIYLSWQKGEGAMVHLWRDDTGLYGLRQVERPNGTFGHVAAVSDDVKPAMIKEHGTKIVLVGQSVDDNTMLAPEGVSAKDRWILKYLNTRYFRFPKNITITAREGLQTSNGRKKGLVRNAYGQEHFLKSGSVANGIVDLDGAKAHWWIVKPSDELVTDGPSYETTGHVAALYQDELYEMRRGRAGRAILQQFGLIFGTNRVVIYIEPTELDSITTNTARTHLILKGDDLPWADWAMEFSTKMPKKLREFMEEISAAALNTDHEKTIRDRLKPMLDLYRVTRYRPSKNATDNVDDDTLVTGGAPRPRDRPATPGGNSRSGTAGGTAGGVYGVFQKDDGQPADPIQPDVFPKVKWVSASDEPPTRTVGDIEDRAARFLPEQNTLLINADFRVFTDMVDRWVKKSPRVPGARAVCEDEIRSWFEQTLVEAVIGVQALKESKEWSMAHIQSALSEEALTLAVMPRYHVENCAKRGIRSKLGKGMVAA